MVNAYSCISVVMAACTVFVVVIFSWCKWCFYVDMLNTKFVDNFLILLVLKFHDFKPAGLGVIDFTNLLSTFACALNKSEWLLWLTYLNI